MAQLFSNPAGLQLLADLREIFRKKPVYRRRHRFIIFVCGGTLGEGQTSLRKQFIEWAKQNLPEFICLVAEDAFEDSFAGERRAFVNLAKFESVVADVADCVLIFPESPGSFAETGFFANSRKIRRKTLVVNSIANQGDSFLNLGPIHTIGRNSFLQPTVWITAQEPPDFTTLGQRLIERVRWPHRERLLYQRFGAFNFKEKLLVVFEILMLLRLADVENLRHALSVCFESTPQYQELMHLLRILLAAKFIQRDAESPYFKAVAGLNLIDIEHVEIAELCAQVSGFYQRHYRELYDALSEVPQ